MDQSSTPPGEGWANYRKLVLAEIDRLDRSIQQLAARITTFIENWAEKISDIRREIDLLKGRHAGLASEIESTYLTSGQVDEIVRAAVADALAAERSKDREERMKIRSEEIRGLWEFRVALISGFVSLVVAIISLVATMSGG